MKTKKRVVITGLGAVTPLAIGYKESWLALCQGKSGVDKITRFDASAFDTQIAAEVKDFHPEDFMNKRKIRRIDLFTQYALAAAQMAIEDSRLVINSNNGFRTGAILGTCVGGLVTFAENIAAFLDGGLDNISPFLTPMFIPSSGASEISIAHGIKGPSRCISTACASGGHAISDALRLIQCGEADTMIAGGSEAGIVPIFIGSLARLKALSTKNDEPEKASRPFDKNRDGFVNGEGAGIIILEELDMARRRGANIYAELVGTGSNVDAYHATKPDYESQARCMKLALDDAGISPNEVDYINAHGTSTQLNDSAETRAIKMALGQHSKKVLISSNKSMIGHLWGAAGAVEAVFTVLAMRDNTVPPTINYDSPDPECDLDYVPNIAREANVEFAISNSFGFGGMNSVLVFKKFHQ